MMTHSLTVVVTGEVDAGKSTLIGRLLLETGSLAQGSLEEVTAVSKRLGHDVEYAYLLDSFEEERAGQLTIDTTQAFCKVGRGKQLVFVDVPGHRELMSNMLSGTSCADTAVLVVDIQRPVDITTLRHAWILKFLGINEIVVAINKIDAVGYSGECFKRVRDEVDCMFKQNGMVCSGIVPVSARNADNLVKLARSTQWYRGPVLLDALKSGFKKNADSEFRLVVQDSYTLDKEQFLLGTILGGTIRKNEVVNVLPLAMECRVRALRVLSDLPRARYPQSIGIGLDGAKGLGRGQVVCKPPLPSVSDGLRVNIFCVAALDAHEPFTLCCAAQEVQALLVAVHESRNIDDLKLKDVKGVLGPGDIVDATIHCSAPLVYDTLHRNNILSRFILHQNNKICAFGLMESMKA